MKVEYERRNYYDDLYLHGLLIKKKSVVYTRLLSFNKSFYYLVLSFTFSFVLKDNLKSTRVSEE